MFSFTENYELMVTNYFNVTEVFQVTGNISESNRIEDSNELRDTFIFYESERFYPSYNNNLNISKEISKSESVFSSSGQLCESNKIEDSNEFCVKLIFYKSEKFNPSYNNSFSISKKVSKPESVFSSSDKLCESAWIDKTKEVENGEDLKRNFTLSNAECFSISNQSFQVTNKVTFSNNFDATMNFDGSNFYRESSNLFGLRDESLYTKGFTDTVWIICILVLFVTGTFFLGWSTSLEYLFFEVKEEETFL
jgi:hypothetical protein